MTLELVMIVKNSGDVLRRCLQSVKPFIDEWTILDTGSTDHTMDIIHEELDAIPGNLYQEPFIDFSTSRNRSLELSSKKCKYTIVLDDSYELHGGPELLKLLKKGKYDCYSIRIGKMNQTHLDDHYYSLRILRSTLGLVYKGRVHEAVYHSSKYIENESIYINDVEDVLHHTRTASRLTRDIQSLLLDEKEDPSNPRTLYYLSRTYGLLKNHRKMIQYCNKLQHLHHLKKIDPEYLFYSKYEKAIVEFDMEESPNRSKILYNKLIDIQKEFPERAEVTYKMCILMYEEGKFEEVASIIQKLLSFPIPKIYITIFDTSIYEYHIPYLFIDTYFKMGKFMEAIPVLKSMLERYPKDQPLLNMKYIVCEREKKTYEKLSNGKTIVIHMGRFYHVWNPQKETKISGSEYMAMGMAKEFAKMGYRVFVFDLFESDDQKTNYQNTIDNVQFIDVAYFEEFSSKYVIDYLIVSRHLSNLVYYDNIKNVYLWVHDTLPIFSKHSPIFQIHKEKFRGMIVLSEWHRQHVQKNMGIPNEYLILSRNAMYPERFEPEKKTEEIIENKIPYRFIYLSDAVRGLNHLIDMIEKVKEKYPQTTLSIFTKLEQIENDLLNKIKNLDYISLNPRTSQENIAKELLLSDIWLYPTTFEETYCMSALEAMAAGCLVASVKLAGITDTVSNRGVLCDVPITEKENQDHLLEKLFYVMDRPSVKRHYVEKAREWALQQTYENLAIEWVRDIFSRKFSRK